MAKDTKSLKQRVKKVIEVCGRKFRVAWGKGNIGAQFHTIHPKIGGGLIVLGDGPKDEYYQLVNLVHELLEISLTFQGTRSTTEKDGGFLFTLDHETYAEVCRQFTRALINSGVVSVKEVE